MKVITVLARTVNPDFKFSQGGRNMTALENFFQAFERLYKTSEPTKIVDCVVFLVHRNKNHHFSIPTLLSETGVKKFGDSSKSLKYFEDKWLADNNLSRTSLYKHVCVDRSAHPLAKFMFVESEESTKLRFLNDEVGLELCTASTLGWSPMSQACQKCKFIDTCKKITQKNYPELFRIRSEYHESAKRIN